MALAPLLANVVACTHAAEHQQLCQQSIRKHGTYQTCSMCHAHLRYLGTTTNYGQAQCHGQNAICAMMSNMLSPHAVPQVTIGRKASDCARVFQRRRSPLLPSAPAPAPALARACPARLQAAAQAQLHRPALWWIRVRARPGDLAGGQRRPGAPLVGHSACLCLQGHVRQVWCALRSHCHAWGIAASRCLPNGMDIMHRKTQPHDVKRKCVERCRVT